VRDSRAGNGPDAIARYNTMIFLQFFRDFAE